MIRLLWLGCGLLLGCTAGSEPHSAAEPLLKFTADTPAGQEQQASDSVTLGKLRMRQATLHMLPGGRFSVTSASGKVLAERIDADQLAEEHTELFDAYRQGMAGVLDASVERELLRAPDAIPAR